MDSKIDLIQDDIKVLTELPKSNISKVFFNYLFENHPEIKNEFINRNLDLRVSKNRLLKNILKSVFYNGQVVENQENNKYVDSFISTLSIIFADGFSNKLIWKELLSNVDFKSIVFYK